MTYWTKPTVIISKCLNNNPCRYNGESSPCKIIDKLKLHTNIIEVCPEEAIGLPTPRNPIRLVNKDNSIQIIDPKTFSSYTKEMVEFAEEISLTYENLKPQGFLFKGKSPSCGLKNVKIYSSLEKGASSSNGMGLFSSAISERFNDLPIEEDGRLNNLSIRENFFTKIFVLSNFEECKNSHSFESLKDFHSKNKLLFMSYGQSGFKRLEEIILNSKNVSLDDIITLYYNELIFHLSNPPKNISIINTYKYTLNYFKKQLSSEEINFFLSILNKYKDEKLPSSVPLNLLQSYAIRFNNIEILSQTIFSPFPEDLISLSDSSKKN